MIIRRVGEASDQGAAVEELRVSGSFSPIRTPGRRVAIGAKGPRIASGASGLGSKVSNWLGPPPSQNLDHRRVAAGTPRGPGLRPQPADVGQGQAAAPGEQARLQEAPAGHSPRRG